jgi:hypothetical protein
LELITTLSQVMVPETLMIAAPPCDAAAFKAEQVVTVVVGPPLPPVVVFVPSPLTEAHPMS